jgi:hypothetical protein
MAVQGPRQDPGGVTLKENIDLTPGQEANLRAQLDPTQLVATVYTADGALSKNSGLKVLSKTSAIAATLAAPTAAEEGQQLIITNGTAFAHVVTATSLIHDGVTGGAKSTMTFGAFLGASIHLIAYNLLWHVVAKNVCTIT